MEEPRLTTRRRCPYCGNSIELGNCPTVATSVDRALLDPEYFEKSDIELPSGTKPLDFLPRTNWPVVARSPRELIGAQAEANASQMSTVERAFTNPAKATDGPLPPLFGDGVFREDVPARACYLCEFPLPQGIDRRPALVVGVVGVNRVGKTHLIAASLTQAFRNGGLAKIGCSEFNPDDATNRRFREDYFVPLFREGRILAATNAEDRTVRFNPLTFDVTLPWAPPFTLVIHDISGEVLGDRHAREEQATYLRAARGIIFMVDPRDIDSLRDGFPDWVLENNEMTGADQGALLAACLSPGGILDGRTPPPLALTIAKADLLPTVCSESLEFLTPAPRHETSEDFYERITTTSKQVEDFLDRHDAHNVITPARQHDERLRATSNGTRRRVTYHAVSALGSNPDVNEQLTAKVAPVNCLDPLAAILMQAMAAQPAAA